MKRLTKRYNSVVVLSNDYTDKDGEEALKKAMYICNYQNNGVTRYTADAIAEKLSRSESDPIQDEMG
jgi:hypothetical protein